jgi:tetratricopeptide (TPR) repeat protein
MMPSFPPPYGLLTMLLRRAAIVIALAAATAVTAARLHVARERPYDIDVVPSAGALRWMSIGHPLLAANLYWLAAVQYIGEPNGDARGWDKLFPLAELVTQLDPGHGYAYQVSGVVLAAKGRVHESSALLEKGTENVRDRYILPYLRAFNAFYHEGDWTAAGRWAEIAAKTPGAPEHVRLNVLAYYVKGQRADAAIAFLEQVLRDTNDPESRKAVEAQLRQAIFERDAGAIERAAGIYRERHGVLPPFLGALVAEGLLPAIPADPFGGQWQFDRAGRIRSSNHEFRYQPSPTAEELYDPALGRPTKKKESR